MTLVGTDAPNQALVEDGTDSTTIRISDAGGVFAGVGCEQVDPETALCVIYPPRAISAYLRGGDDLLELEASGVSVRAAQGGSGRDTLAGNARRDTLVGDQGADQLRGAHGPDRLVGSDGHDILRGGPGKDRLFAADGIRDKLLDCGRGQHDRAEIDRKDPKPKNCESVTIGRGE